VTAPTAPPNAGDCWAAEDAGTLGVIRAVAAALRRRDPAAAQTTPAPTPTATPPVASPPSSSGVTTQPIEGGLAIRIAETVLFDGDSAQLRPDASVLIASVAQQLRQAGPGTVDVQGHAADVGPGDGLQLSTQRADAVAGVLRIHLAGTALTIQASGLGESQPVAPNDTEENRSRNRRVEIIYQAQ